MRFLRVPVLVVLLVATSLVPSAVGAAAPTALAVRLVIDSPTPREFVVEERDTIIHAVDGVYTVPVRRGNGGKAYFQVRVLLDDGTPGPWLVDVGSGHYSYTWGWGDLFSVDARHRTVAPISVVDDRIPDYPEEPVGAVRWTELTGSIPLLFFYLRQYDVPEGSSTVIDFFGCAGDAPVATFVSRATTADALLVEPTSEQIGRAGRAVVTVHRPGQPDFVLATPLKLSARCDPDELLRDDVGLLTDQHIDEVNSRNGFPVWRRGQRNPLPASAVRWGSPRGALRVGETAVPTFIRQVRVRFYDVRYRWTVGGKRVGRDVHEFRRIKPAWVGKRVTVRVTVDPESWDGTLTRTFRLGRVRR